MTHLRCKYAKSLRLFLYHVHPFALVNEIYPKLQSLHVKRSEKGFPGELRLSRSLQVAANSL